MVELSFYIFKITVDLFIDHNIFQMPDSDVSNISNKNYKINI